MKLPNGERAVVDMRKLAEYVLSPDHLYGQHKARVFQSALGLTLADADELYAALLVAANVEEATPTHADQFGQRYVIDFVLNRRNGRSARIRSSWMIRHDEDHARFVTCYVL